MLIGNGVRHNAQVYSRSFRLNKCGLKCFMLKAGAPML